jgi:hypothetical protein
MIDNFDSSTITRTTLGLDGILSLENLFSRRALIDFAAGVVYVEDNSDSEQASMLLTRMSSCPFVITRSAITLAPIPGEESVYTDEGAFGSTLLDLNGVPADAWRHILMDGSGAMTDRLNSLANSFAVSIKAKVRLSSGETTTLEQKR